jgi:hypothetical protein
MTRKKVLQKLAQLIDATTDREDKIKIQKDYLLLKINNCWVVKSTIERKYFKD